MKTEQQVPKPDRALIQWLLDSDPSIRWQVMRDLIGASAEEVAAERARIATEGTGARLLALQGADGRWGGAAWNRGWTSTMHVLMLLLERRLFRRRATGAVIERDRKGGAAWTRFAFPTWWHYDVLRGLDYLRCAGVAPDERVSEAIDLVASKRDDDGRWPLEVRYPGDLPVEIDEGEGWPSRWNTLRALRVLSWYSAGLVPEGRLGYHESASALQNGARPESLTMDQPREAELFARDTSGLVKTT